MHRELVRPAWRPDRLVELTRRIGRGDRVAVADLYDATSPCVYGLALTVLRSPELAAAATQEVYAQVWRSASEFDPNHGSVMAWLMALTHRQVADRVRPARDETPAEPTTPATLADELGRGDGGLRLDAERARRALGSLEDPQRQVVTLAYFGGLSQRQVARDLGLPMSTVRTYIRDGLVQLRDAMGVGS